MNIRFKQYFNYNHISYPKRNSRIYSALLKYGYAGFRLEILEYCHPEVLLKREQYYFDMLDPELNILKVAGSPLGYRHSEAAKKLIGLAAKNREVSESSRDLKRRALLGKSFDKEHIEKMRLSNTFRKPVLITNTETGDRLEFTSMAEAGKHLGITRFTIRKYFLNGTPYKEYTISAKGFGLSLKDKEMNKVSFEGSQNDTKISQQAVLITNKETGGIKEFSSITNAAKYLEISRTRLGNLLSSTLKIESETIKGYTISKIVNTQNKPNRKTKNIKVTNINTNEVTIYPSLTLAGEALGVSQASLSGYFANKRTNPFKNKYILELV